MYKDAPQPLTARIAYQQGKAIAFNLKALSGGRSTSPAKVKLRGTLMKLYQIKRYLLQIDRRGERLFAPTEIICRVLFLNWY
jgi:NADH dehydrogenase FAD-containing subunit